MSTIALSSAVTRYRRHIPAIQSPYPLLSVLAWEMRRFRASRLFLFQILGFFCLTLFVIWASRITTQLHFANPHSALSFTVFVAGTSAWGLLQNLPVGPMLLLGVLLPFVSADGVTRDMSRRTHELLMATPLPNWAYIWGRYLTSLLVSLGLAVLLLVAILGMGLLLHLNMSGYPQPQPGVVLLLWASLVVPATILVSSISFVIGTVFPQQTTLAKIVIMLAWFIGAVILTGGGGQTNFPAWYINWDPTSAATTLSMLSRYQTNFANLPHIATSVPQVQHALLSIENMVPDISSWLAPHLIEDLLGLLLVALVANTFRRFREVLGA
jgi:ABC-type transport system involved in multi-copper enzyme maturation permease subunit